MSPKQTKKQKNKVGLIVALVRKIVKEFEGDMLQLCSDNRLYETYPSTTSRQYGNWSCRRN